MGKKAKGDHTPEQPPLNDYARWMPLVEAVARLIKRTTSKRLAVHLIEKWMESGKLPYMRWDATTGEWETPPPGLFTAYCIHYSDEGHVTVYRGEKNDPRRWDLFFPHPEDEPPDHVYFVSGSHFEGLWSESQPQAEPQSDSEKPKDGWQVARVKELLPIVYPHGVPADRMLENIKGDLEPECAKRGWRVPSTDSIARALGRRRE